MNHNKLWSILMVLGILLAFTMQQKWLAVIQAAMCGMSFGWHMENEYGKHKKDHAD